MTVDSSDLAINLAKVASQWESISGLDATLIRVTEGVRQTIPEVAYASITTRSPKGELRTLAPTDVIAGRADQLQYDAAEGPCYEVVTCTTTLTSTEDLAAEDRWPDYAPSAAALGVRSQLAVGVYEDGRSRAGLNLYSSQPGIFGKAAQTTGRAVRRPCRHCHGARHRARAAQPSSVLAQGHRPRHRDLDGALHDQ